MKQYTIHKVFIGRQLKEVRYYLGIIEAKSAIEAISDYLLKMYPGDTDKQKKKEKVLCLENLQMGLKF